MSKFGQFLKANSVLSALLMLASVAAVWFAISAITDTRDFRRNPPTDPDLQAWMTPHYVGLSYGLPRREIRDIFDMEGSPTGRETLAEIAARLETDLAGLTRQVRAQAADFRDREKERRDEDGHHEEDSRDHDND